jgi:hypothetical protein
LGWNRRFPVLRRHLAGRHRRGKRSPISGGAAGDRARAANPDLSRYAPGGHGIVFTQIPLARVAGAKSFAAGMLRASYGDGGRLVLLTKDGSTRVLTADFESAADPAISFDGKRILFAAKKSAGDRWNIFEMAADGSGIHQVTHEAGNCRTPMYQSALFYLNDARPSYQVTFVSDVAGELNEVGPPTKTDLYSVRFDGTGLRRLTYGVSASYDPFQMQDGRILFSNWQRSHWGRGSWAPLICPPSTLTEPTTPPFPERRGCASNTWRAPPQKARWRLWSPNARHGTAQGV